MSRPRDDIRVVTEDGTFDRFKSLEVSQDFNEVGSCTLSFGDDGSLPSVLRMIKPGRSVAVSCNGYRIFTGRFEAHGEPLDAGSGMQVQCVARTKLSDARVSGANPGLLFRNTTLKAFLLKLFEPLGYAEKDFQFSAAAARNLQTGRATGAPKPVDLDKPKFDQLKVQPPETVWECASRVLKWHHLMIWDAGDGRIIVGRPDDTQAPTYRFLCRRYPNADANNVLSIRPAVDWSEVVGEVHVHANTYGRDIRRSPIQGVSVDLDLAAEAARSGNFSRIIYIPSDGARTKGYAQAQSRREMAARQKTKATWEVDADGWSQWQGNGLVNFTINTVADIQSDVHEGLGGPFLVQRIARRLDVDKGPTTLLGCVGKGIYDI